MNKLYEKYHSVTKLQKRIIDSNSFTYKYIIELLDRNILTSKRILDVGCGVGTIAFYLGSKGNSVTGIDISEKAINVAKENTAAFSLTNVKFLCVNVKDFKIKKKFDVITCFEIIEHVPDDLTLLKRLKVFLKQDGVILLTTPLNTAPLYKLGLTKNFDKRVGHLRRYDEERLTFLIKKSGLEVKDIVYNEGAFRNLFFVFKLFDPIVRIANRFPFVSSLFTLIDNINLSLFGPSDIGLVITK